MTAQGSGEQILAAALGLRPLINSLRDEIEHTRCIPEALISALRETGVARMWLPKELGGPELSIPEFVRVIETLAYADGSVGWCASFAAAYTRFAGYFPENIARQILDGPILAGSLVPAGRGMKVSGGYRLTGRWAWGSGITHSDWLFGMFRTRVGNEPLMVNGQPEMRIAFFPKSPEVEIIDTWNVGGMRGTGSHDYAVTDLFVPDEYTLNGVDPQPQVAGRLYAISLNSVYPLVIAATILGVATAAFDTFLDIAQVKTPISGSLLLRDKPTVQAMIGRSEALLDSAREFYYATANILSDSTATNVPLTLEMRARVRLAVAQVGEVAKHVVRNLYDAAGGSSVYESCPLERHFRDVHAAAQHVQVSPNNFEFAGRVILGLEPGTARF